MDYESDDQSVSLSSASLAALAEFQAEKEAQKAAFDKLVADAEAGALKRDAQLSIESFVEDWNESQFWYSENTANQLAEELLDGAGADTTIVVVSTPSVFVALKNILAKRSSSSVEGAVPSNPSLVLLEHDSRFAVFPEFVFYDFQQPLRLPGRLKGCADRIMIDPPFLNEDCQTKMAMTIRWLAKPSLSGADPLRLLLCTGERMEKLATKLYRPFGLKTTTFDPEHVRELSNRYYCYANFASQYWDWRR